MSGIRYSFINIGGLAVCMAVAILIGLWVHNELSYNTYHKNYNRIAQVIQNQNFYGEINTSFPVSIPMANELRTVYGSEFKHVVLSSWAKNHIISVENKNFKKSGSFMQSEAPEMLSLKMLKGSRSALKDPTSVLLSESLAKTFFADTYPMNKIIKIDNKLTAKVAGIYEDIPNNAYFNNLEFISSWDSYETTEEYIKEAQTDWTNNVFVIDRYN